MNDIKCKENPRIQERCYSFRHSSGLVVYMSPKDLRTEYAVLSVRFGGMNTAFYPQPGHDIVSIPRGIAHFLEHKLFEMPDGSDAFDTFAKLGANANAYTTASQTSYLISCTERFEESLETLIRMVFTPHFTDSAVRREREIIKQEILTGEDQPGARLYRSVLTGMFEKHEIIHNICGSPESLETITPELLYTCHRTFYTPDRMVLAVSGSADCTLIKHVLDRVFDDVLPPKPTAAAFVIPEERGAVVTTYTEMSLPIAKPMVEIGIKDVGFVSDGYTMTRRSILADIAHSMLFGTVSPLFEKLQNQGDLQDCFSHDYTDEPGCAFSLIAAETDHPQKVIDSVYQTLDHAAVSPPSEDDFILFRRCIYADYLRLFDSTEEIAEEMLDNFFAGVDLLDVGDITESLTYAEFFDVIRDMTRPEYRTAAVAMPDGQATGQNSDTPKTAEQE